MTVLERFNEFHKNNPSVYRSLVKLALETKGKGFNKYSIAGLFEIFRWQVGITTNSSDGFKISNDFKPYYSRLIMGANPLLNGFFNTKDLKTGGVIATLQEAAS